MEGGEEFVSTYVITRFSLIDRLRPIFIAKEAPPRALRAWRLREGAQEHATGVYANQTFQNVAESKNFERQRM